MRTKKQNKRRKRKKKQNIVIEFLQFLQVETKTSLILSHVRRFVFRGVLAIIPIALSAMAIRFLYVLLDKRITTFTEKIIGFSFPGLGIILVLVTLYILGVIASNVLGKQFLNLLERITNKIPLVNTTYQVGKQLSNTLSLPERQVFKHAVLVEFPQPGSWSIGFVTGILNDLKNEERLLKVFIPFPPNPATGNMIMVTFDKIRDPGWTVEDAMKVVISAGIIGPCDIKESNTALLEEIDRFDCIDRK